MLRDRQAKSRPCRVRSGVSRREVSGACARAVGLIETLEDARQVLRRDAHTGVAHANRQRRLERRRGTAFMSTWLRFARWSAARTALRRDGYDATCRSELQRVVDQVH